MDVKRKSRKSFLRAKATSEKVKTVMTGWAMACISGKTTRIVRWYFDSLRAAFIEGERIYPGAGFYDKTHVQICVRNPNCVKGFFLPRKEQDSYATV